MYDILMDSQVVGQADVKKEGLYYRIVCRCKPLSEGIHRVRVENGEISRDLGICVPTGDDFSLTTRVPVKYLPGDKLTFQLIPKDAPQKVVPVAQDQPFAYLDMLESATLRENRDQAEILINPAQDPQDSDQSRESQDIWEQR